MLNPFVLTEDDEHDSCAAVTGLKEKNQQCSSCQRVREHWMEAGDEAGLPEATLKHVFSQRNGRNMVPIQRA